MRTDKGTAYKTPTTHAAGGSTNSPRRYYGRKYNMANLLAIEAILQESLVMFGLLDVDKVMYKGSGEKKENTPAVSKSVFLMKNIMFSVPYSVMRFSISSKSIRKRRSVS